MKRLRKTKKGVIPDMNENDNGLGTNEREERDADITAPAEEKTAPFASPAGDSMSDTDNSAIFEPSSAADSDTADITASTEKAADTAEGEPDNSPESEPDSESDKSDGAPSSEISLEEIKKASANASPAADDPEIVSQIADIGELVSKEGKRRKNRDSRSLAAYLISFLPGFLCAGVLMFSIMSNSAVGIGSGGAYRIHFFVLCAIMAVSIVAGPMKVKSTRVKSAIGWVWWAICPAAAMLLSEWMIRNPFNGKMTWKVIILNMVIYYITAAFFLFLTRRAFWSTVLATVFPALLGIANYYVVSFRGTVLFPWDLGSIGTAISVADNYKFEFPYEMAILISAFILMYQIACKCGVKIFAKKIWLRVLLTVMSLSMGVGYAFYAQSDDIVSRFRLYPYMFTPNSVYSRDGMMVSLLFSLKYLAVDKPEGYDADLVNGVAEKYADDGGDGTSAEEKTKPNIIVIMNEAYSDLSVLRDFETNVNPMPFTSKLTENTVKGDLYVSVVGGNTANSEFEFLTGSSMAFLPTGSIPYQQFIKGEMPSFVSHLNDLGYSSSAMHPYYASGWDRNKVYSYFGFDKMFFKNDFNNPETIRQYISDAATYDKIIELYENKGDSPMFVFDVTMQNHSGYKGEVQNNFAPLVTVTDGKVSTGLSEYLSLVRISDLAFGDLVEYFKEADEPTVILMFGDHQPGDAVVRSLYTSVGQTYPPESFEDQYKRYIVPFFLWANFDIEEKDDVTISANYLSTLLCEVAGIELTPQMKYLSELYEKYPVLNANGYIDSDGNLFSADKINENDDLTEYSCIQYNLLFDRKNRVEALFK